MSAATVSPRTVNYAALMPVHHRVSGRCMRSGADIGTKERPGEMILAGPLLVSRGGSSDRETEGAQLLAAVLGDLVRTPRREPHPVDLQFAAQPAAHERAAGLVLDDIGQRARRGREGHVEGDDVLFLGNAVHEAEVDDVDAQFRVDDVAHRLFEYLEAFRVGHRARRGRGGLALVGRRLLRYGGGVRLRRLRLAHDACPPIRAGSPAAVGTAESCSSTTRSSTIGTTASL